jgi:EAL domain-containing protein (putative c-di-GMP-specific phosphodiesterase class I)
VNLSNRHLSHSGFRRLDQLAGRHHVAPSSVSLEITESAAMLDPGHAQVLLASATRASLALDDFGTGYSSLSHVKRLPIDTLRSTAPRRRRHR